MICFSQVDAISLSAFKRHFCEDKARRYLQLLNRIPFCDTNTSRKRKHQSLAKCRNELWIAPGLASREHNFVSSPNSGGRVPTRFKMAPEPLRENEDICAYFCLHKHAVHSSIKKSQLRMNGGS